MKLCKVVGKTWAELKDENLTGAKFVLAREINSKGMLSENLIIAVDELGAGEGDTVIIAEGNAVLSSNFSSKPVDAVIIAIVEGYSINEK